MTNLIISLIAFFSCIIGAFTYGCITDIASPFGIYGLYENILIWIATGAMAGIPYSVMSWFISYLLIKKMRVFGIATLAIPGFIGFAIGFYLLRYLDNSNLLYKMWT